MLVAALTTTSIAVNPDNNDDGSSSIVPGGYIVEFSPALTKTRTGNHVCVSRYHSHYFRKMIADIVLLSA